MNNYFMQLGFSFLFLILNSNSAHANIQKCKTVPLVVTTKTVGTVSYYADNCHQNWESQNIQLDFSYDQNIPEWAFKKAANYYLKKNISNFANDSVLNQITELYKPVKKGDLYSLAYSQMNQQLKLSLNQKLLGSITDPQANQYFKIWFGSSPFNAKLKQQLLNQ
ncbi:chalcone isomerase family protein [Acinetobacter dispersus]|uniref:chalcone isomerase family protein n=1 Tax=Acinetobacter dispersus TaxID=70348 RepID=UPI001F4B8527|nr:chalcone isomerase family protein [Acinetobacter dispersus]MCH7383116.1 chalcone isomerase family protein [Acinetobacter dispersus]